ncbi:hypothetical protein OIDMADRAFT_150007 [Oidiodendron maius Zn]|uniref:Uncharacterized protein n=1 Tax=Oidiodendron maius (strain Zn) TaxID=913774 RepID=A0A0C3G8Z9_OIDMZ|nr:hypothetical protein OIDMADRAFT_150007 [Oidiodendron maius Zn]
MVWATLNLILVASIFSYQSSAIKGNALSPNEILNKGIEAVGGGSLESNTRAFLPFLSLEESQGPGHPDTSVASSGSETISYDFSGNLSDVAQRIDKKYTLGKFWNFAPPNLDPILTQSMFRLLCAVASPAMHAM